MKPLRYFELVHHVGLEESNALGNVYFAHHVRWQGRCREAFLSQHTPEVIALLGQELDLVTVRCSCEYLAELHAFDVVAIRLSIGELSQHRLTLRFEYVVTHPRGPELVARGEQVIAAMTRLNGVLTPRPLPEELRAALRGYLQ